MGTCQFAESPFCRVCQCGEAMEVENSGDVMC